MTTPEVSAIRDADRVVGKLDDRGMPMRLIVNRLRPDMVRSGDMLSVDDVCEICRSNSSASFPTTRRSSTRPIAANRSCSTRPIACARIYEKIARRLEGEIVPFTNFDGQGFFGRFIDALKAG